MIIETKSAKETYDLGKKIGSHAKAGEVYTLVGDRRRKDRIYPGTGKRTGD